MRRLSLVAISLLVALACCAVLLVSLTTAGAQAPVRVTGVTTTPVICDYTPLTFSISGVGNVGDTRPFTTTTGETYLQFAPAAPITTTASSAGAALLNSTFTGNTLGGITGTFSLDNLNGLAVTGSTVSPEARGFMVNNLVVNDPQGGGTLTLIFAVNFAATTSIAPYYPRNITGYVESIATTGTYAPYHFSGTISGMMGAPSSGNVPINATIQGKLIVTPPTTGSFPIGGERVLPPLRNVTLSPTDYLAQLRQADIHPDTTLGSVSAMSVFEGNVSSFGSSNAPITGTFTMDNHSLLSGNQLDFSKGWIVSNFRITSNLSADDKLTTIWISDLPGVSFKGFMFQVAGAGRFEHTLLYGYQSSGAISYEHGRDIATALDTGYYCSDFQQTGATPTATPAPPTATATPPASCDTPNFGTATSFVVGQDPFAVTTADFNEDGKNDAAVAVFGLNNVSVLLGNGSGGFSPLTAYPVGSRPVAIVAADINHDQHTDLITANQFANNISVLLGNGAGGFASAVNFPVGSLPDALALGDLNHDNNLDVAVTNTGDNNISVLLGNGTSGFGTATNTSIGGTPRSVVIDDFNNDGNNDMAVANATAANISVWLGNGSGGFGAPSTFAVGGDPYSIAAGYLNNDSNLDLISANRNSNSVSVLLGNGTGGFGSATNYGVGNGPVFVALGDLNSDGKLDIAVANSNMLNISVRLGNGAGGFGALSNFTVGLNPFAVAISDLNGDASPDLITANDSSLDISVLLNACTLAAPSPTATATRTATSTATSLPATATSTSTSTPIATTTGTPPATSTGTGATSTPDPTMPPATSTPTQPAATGTSTGTPAVTATSTVITTATATACTLQFTDVLEGSTFYPYVRCLACLGIASGYPDSTFRPQNDITRGQTSKIVANAAGYADTIAPTQQTFTDVPPDSTFWLYIERMMLHGVIGGYPDGTFRPANNASRGQIAKIVSNSAGYSDTPDGQTFSDVPADSPFYVWIERLASREIIGGYPDGTFRPANNASRGQMAKIVSTAFFPDCAAQ